MRCCSDTILIIAIVAVDVVTVLALVDNAYYLLYAYRIFFCFSKLGVCREKCV